MSQRGSPFGNPKSRMAGLILHSRIMGYAVLHFSKTVGSDTGTSGHIERKVQPENADASRKHLNRELVQFPEGVHDRTHAIQHRLKNAGIKRKIAKNQVMVIRVNLSGSNEDMKRIEQEGRLDDWANDSLEWLQDTFGKENIVSAVLHRDETTSHIHAALVPVVTGERRKAMKEKEDRAKTGKRSYRKKSTDTVRLCADDVMTRKKLEDYQTTYAERVAKYGLQRGIKGSEARHKTTQEYYRELFLQQKTLKEDIEQKEQLKSDIEQQYTQLSKQTEDKTKELEKTKQSLDETKQKLQKEKQAVKTAEIKTKITETVSLLLGTPKYQLLEQEVESLQKIAAEKEKEIENLRQKAEKREDEFQHHIQELNEYYQTKLQEKESEKSQLQKAIDKFIGWMPKLTDYQNIEKEAKSIGLPDNWIKELIQGESLTFSGNLWSKEYSRFFQAKDSIAKIEENSQKSGNKLHLTIDGLSITEWCRMKFRELSVFRGKGMRM